MEGLCKACSSAQSLRASSSAFCQTFGSMCPSTVDLPPSLSYHALISSCACFIVTSASDAPGFRRGFSNRGVHREGEPKRLLKWRACLQLLCGHRLPLPRG